MTEKMIITKPIIVEGKYDKAKLSSIIDGVILVVDGFSIYRNKKKADLIRKLAQKEGIIILTDSDKAGFQLRNFIRSVVNDGKITNIYIPQIEGKEKRKAAFSKQGLLGVEGISTDILRELFLKANVLKDTAPIVSDPITKMDLYNDGYIGKADSALKRQQLIKHLNLPTHVSTTALLDIINRLMTRESYQQFTPRLESDNT